MEQNFSLAINHTSNHLSIIDFLSTVDKTKALNLKIDIQGGFINSDCYLLLCSFINEMRANGIEVRVSLLERRCDAVNYASRINVFNHLGVDYTEPFKRHNTQGNLIPICEIERGAMGVEDEIMQIFQTNFKLSQDDLFQLPLIMQEMICNTSIHSKSKSSAYLYCQKYVKGNELEFILVDSGIGIKKSLEKKAEFVNLTNGEALENCIKFGVTNGEGRGHGLFFASEFVKRNDGSMVLISGNHRVTIQDGNVNIYENPYWDGVFLKFKFKFDAKISLSQLFDEAGYSTN